MTFFGLIGRLGLLLCVASQSHASLDAYDAAITDDARGGLRPLARLTSALTFRGQDRVAFDFGATSGDTTIEFVLEGDPNANTGSYLAVGANARSNLRYELWFDTGQLGFTQLGVLDYAFDPGVPSPTQPAHVAYVWDAQARAMKLYLHGELAGTRESVSPDFAMPAGQGWLGANPSGTEAMVGVVYRVTVYDGRVSEEVIRSHADAFGGVTRPPTIRFFEAKPPTLFTPETVALSWEVVNATGVFLDGKDVTGRTNAIATPTASHTFSLVASNTAGSVRAEASVRVNPPPQIHRFRASRAYARPGESISLSWETSFAQTLIVSPDVGDVTAATVQGAGSIEVQPLESATFVLNAANPFGSASAQVDLRIAQPATHLVISEFMADDESILADEDREYSGWIEVHNPGSEAVNLAGYSLTDDPGNPARWPFPEMELKGGGYLLVFASGKDRAVTGRPLHTSFRLANEGEYLALMAPGGVPLHAFTPKFPPQRPNIAYGILAGDPALVQYLGLPTPGGPNNEALPPPRPVEFSLPGGMFTEPLTVSLTSPDPDAEIWFTLDGSAPGPGAGARYQAPVTVASTTRLRAVAVGPGGASPASGSSYIKLAPDLAGYTSPLPIMVIENFGAGTIKRKGWNSTGVGIKQVPRQPAAWATFEKTDGISRLANPPQMLCLVGIRGRGAYSTEWRQKPYSVEAMDEAGAEVDVAPLGMPPHADWVLYFPDADQNKDPSLLFNTFAYELSGRMGHYAARFRWVEAFINENGGDLSLADRRGVYALIEKVARGKDRLDFQRLSEDGSTGGWLLNINRMDPEPETGWPASNGAMQPWFFHTAGRDRIFQTRPNTAYSSVPGDDLPQQSNAYINFDNPNGHSISLKQRAAIEGWFKAFEDVLFSDAVWRDPVNGYRRFIDPVDFADYFVLNVLTRNGDGLLLSMFPWKGDDGKLRMGPAWDYNWSAYYVSGGPTGSLMHRSDQLWYSRLFADPDFTQLYIDRWWELRRGPMSNSGLKAIIDAQAAEITPEKALLNGMPSASEWSRRLRDMKSWLTQRADWIDSNYLRPPIFAQPGGEVPQGFSVTLTAGSGTVYVTTDNSDPRAPGGSVSPSARVYTTPFAVDQPMTVKARLRSGGKWSGLATAVFLTPQDLAKLVITEIMYEPPASGIWTGEDLEFLELKNMGASPLRLDGFRFTRGIEFMFSQGTQLAPGAFLVLAGNADAFLAMYPDVPIHGVFTGKLSNNGEVLRLETPVSTLVLEMAYGTDAPWPQAAVGGGFSAVPISPELALNSSDGALWRASTFPGGSPGAEDLPPAQGCDPDGAPSIVLQPMNRSTVPGVSLSLSVTVTNTALLPITYQWLRDGEAIPDGTFVLRESVCFLTITNAQAPGARYNVHVSNAACPDGFTSSEAFLSVEIDTDQDGMPDSWEVAFGFRPDAPADADLDADEDGMPNAAEYLAGTDPTDPASRLQIDAVAVTQDGGAILSFRARAARTYTVEFTDALGTGDWSKLEDICAWPEDREESVHDPGFRPNRFYRLITPAGYSRNRPGIGP